MKLNLFGFPANAWDKLDVIPWFLLLAILAALGMAILRIGGSRWEPPIPPSAAVAVLGGLATLLVGYRIVSPPEIVELRGIPVHITVELGAYLSLVAAAAIAYGGYRAMGERGTSFAGVAAALSSQRPRRPWKAAPKQPPRSGQFASKRQSPSSSD